MNELEERKKLKTDGIPQMHTDGLLKWSMDYEIDNWSILRSVSDKVSFIMLVEAFNDDGFMKTEAVSTWASFTSSLLHFKLLTKSLCLNF